MHEAIIKLVYELHVPSLQFGYEDFVHFENFENKDR